MVLEPLVRPRTGMALNALGVVVCGALAIWNETVVTQNGAVELRLVVPGFAAAFLTRILGISAGEGLGRTEMPWGFRAASWALGAGNAWFFGILGSALSLVVAAGIVAADVAGALSPRRPGAARARKARKVPAGALLVAGGVAVLVAAHLLAYPVLGWWPLFDWGAAVVVFAIVLRIALARGGPATEAETRPPKAHRVHARTERPLEDPSRAAAEEAVRAFRETGDVQGLVELAAAVADAARVPDPRRTELLQRVPAMAARAGTTREQDLDAAILVVERALDDRRTVTSTIQPAISTSGTTRGVPR